MSDAVQGWPVSQTKTLVMGWWVPSLPIEDKYCTSAGQVWEVRCKTAAQLYPHSKVGMMAELNKHVTQIIVDTCFTGQGGGD